VLHAALLPDVLVLVTEVLSGLGEPDRGVAAIEERELVPSPQVPVRPVDYLDPHRRDIGGRYLPHSAGELARRRVVLPAVPEHLGEAVVERRRRYPLGEEPHRAAVDPAVLGPAAPYD